MRVAHIFWSLAVALILALGASISSAQELTHRERRDLYRYEMQLKHDHIEKLKESVERKLGRRICKDGILAHTPRLNGYCPERSDDDSDFNRIVVSPCSSEEDAYNALVDEWNEFIDECKVRRRSHEDNADKKDQTQLPAETNETRAAKSK